MQTPITFSKHSLLDDAQALLAGTLLFSLGTALLGGAQLITGGAVGLAFLLHYTTGMSFGALVFAINLPFYLLALRRMGPAFVFKTFFAVLLLSVFSEWMPAFVPLAAINPLYASVMGGLLMGVGLLILFRHGASLGGFGILALYLQERRGWRAGSVQLTIDGLILACSLLAIPAASVAISVIGAAVLNATLSINHRPDRYVAA